MSHTTSIKAVKIQSITALQAAVEELNTSGTRCSLVPNSTPRAYSAGQAGLGMADFVVKVPDAKYDIGLYKQDDGTYEARTDFWMGSVERVMGVPVIKAENAMQAKMGKLFQMYGVHAATEAARRKGHSVRRIVKADGTISLELTGNNL